MGLDQSLYREVQLKGKMKITDEKLDRVLGGENMKPSVRHEVCYWRKFNALHKYFDDHFNEQDNDNCVDMYMNIEDLEKLLGLVKKIKSEIKMGEGWVSNGGGYDIVDLDTTIKTLDGEKKAEKLEQGDLIEVKGQRAIVYSVRKDSRVHFGYNYQERGQTIINPEVCEELPTEEGFFFGSTDYDEYYVGQLDETIEQVGKVIEEHKELVKAGVAEHEIDYYYRAWY